MTQFDKELKYVKDTMSKVITPTELSNAKRLKKEFLDTYVVLISATDKHFLDIQNELNELERLTIKRISSAYFFGRRN